MSLLPLLLRFNRKKPLISIQQGDYTKGDPLSSLLFVLCMERFSAIINNAVHQGLWKHITCRSNVPKISHLAFADDFILFSKATRQGLQVIKDIIRKFSQAPGQ